MKSLSQYFEGKLNSSKFEQRTRAARLRILLKKFNGETPWPTLPTGQLIIIADGLIEFFRGEKYAIYFILVRSISSSKAFILPPYMKEGGETPLGWEEAFSNIPDEVFGRVKALVCDGHTGLVSLAKRYGWRLQRCHFHLLSRLAHCASFGPLNKTRDIGIRVKKLMQVILYQKDLLAVNLALNELWNIKKAITSRTFKVVVSGFIKHYEDFRTYLNYPEYCLPTTSNSAEFLNAQIRGLQYRARGFRTPQSLFAWIVGLCKSQKSVTCRGKFQPN